MALTDKKANKSDKVELEIFKKLRQFCQLLHSRQTSCRDFIGCVHAQHLGVSELFKL